VPGSDRVHKISIIPRGHRALGYTLQLPEEDRFLISKKELFNRIKGLLGGRVAEEIQFGDVTSGAQNDLERATQTARQMITELGMSEKLGPVTLGRKQHEVFLGRDIVDDRNYSEEIAFAIDQEVRAIIDGCYEEVRNLLLEKKDLLVRIADTLLEQEIIEADDLDAIIDGTYVSPVKTAPEQTGEVPADTAKPKADRRPDAAGSVPSLDGPPLETA
jgi:cell division protease FtsH